MLMVLARRHAQVPPRTAPLADPRWAMTGAHGTGGGSAG